MPYSTYIRRTYIQSFKMSEKNKVSWVKYLIAGGLIVAVYFINVEIQTRLGEKVLEESGLQYHSLDEALALAKQQDKLVLADLSAIWCPSCRSLDKNVLSDPTVHKVIEEKYVFARIEYESPEGEAFQEQYETRIFPTLLVLNSSGERVRKLPVIFDPEEFIGNL